MTLAPEAVLGPSADGLIALCCPALRTPGPSASDGSGDAYCFRTIGPGGSYGMQVETRRASPGDYEAIECLYRELHEFHASERPDLFQKNATGFILQKANFEAEIASDSHIYIIAYVHSSIVGVASIKSIKR